MPNDVSYEDILNKDILELMGAKNMPEEEKKNLYTKILETIQNRVIARVADSLTDEDMKKWAEIKGDKEKATQFLADKGIDLGKLYLQEALIYKTELVNLSQAARNAAKAKE